MEFKPKNRDWVKNAAIAFLTILLVLTFFSNTIMNRTLPEVATQYVESGPITAKVRGTGTVSANGSHQVKADQTREIRAVMVKTGQEVNAGDVLFVLGAGDSEELEAAQDTLRQLQVSYQKTAISMPVYDYSLDEKRIQRAEEDLETAKKVLDSALKDLQSHSGASESEIKTAAEDLKNAQKAYDDIYKESIEKKIEAQKNVDDAQAYLDGLLNGQAPAAPASAGDTGAEDEPVKPQTAAAEGYEEGETVNPDEGGASTPPTPTPPEESAEIKAARKALENAKTRQITIETEYDAKVALAKSNLDRCQEKLDRLISAPGPYKTAYEEALAAKKAAEDNVFSLKFELEQKKINDSKSAQLAAIDLSDIATQMDKQKKKIRELSGGEENEITANVSGTVQTVDCTAGDTKMKDDLLCTIEVPDMGYTLSFSVTNEQARRLRPGDSATVSNYYWGSQITATLSTIKVDPKNPQTNKLLTFDVTGDVNAGAELTISVGQKSANYDVVIPNSAIRSDTNGSFVLKIEAKNSPLGNRYIARRVSVEVLAADDVSSAVTGDLGWGDYVITTSSAPVKAGDQVRMADS